MSNPINYWYQKYQSLKAEMDKMLKEAVEGTYATGHFSSPCIYVPQQDLKLETPVRVIIVKEDGKRMQKQNEK